MKLPQMVRLSSLYAAFDSRESFFPPVSEAPLALRSAKLAISRALELSLEPGESRPLTSSLSRSRAFYRAGF